MSSASMRSERAAPTNEPTPPKKSFFDLANSGFILILYDIFFLLPLSYTVTLLVKSSIELLGEDEVLDSTIRGLLLRSIFGVLNITLVSMWAIKLARDEMIRQVQELEAQMLHEHVKEVGNQIQLLHAGIQELRHIVERQWAIHDSEEDSDEPVISDGEF